MKLNQLSLILLLVILVPACSGAGEGENLNLKPVAASETPTPVFFTLELSANPAQGGEVLPGDGEYSANSKVILNAIPSKGYVFESWSGDHTGSGNSPEITIDGDMMIFANFTQLATPTPRPTATATPVPCRKPAEVSPDDAGQIIEVCGEVTNWGAVPCPKCALGSYSFLKLEGEFLIISYDWIFTTGWIGNCMLVADTVEMLGADPVFVFGVSEGYAGSECTTKADGSRSCVTGDYFQQFFECESSEY